MISRSRIACLIGGVALNESINWKHAVASAVRAPKMRISLGVRCMAWCAVLVFASLPALALAQSACAGIHVKILNIKNRTGNVACALFESPVGFPRKFLTLATNVMLIKIRKTQARCDFEDIPKGTYAMVVIHDENMNGKLDTNWVGVPTEGYGFSTNAKGALGAPSFSAASFPYDGQNLDLTISLHY